MFSIKNSRQHTSFMTPKKLTAFCWKFWCTVIALILNRLTTICFGVCWIFLIVYNWSKEELLKMRWSYELWRSKMAKGYRIIYGKYVLDHKWFSVDNFSSKIYQKTAIYVPQITFTAINTFSKRGTDVPIHTGGILYLHLVKKLDVAC